MKFSVTLALAVFVGLVASSTAFPAQKKVIYYQRPAQYYAAPQQRMMYVQYTHPSPYARSTQAAEALVAGESVATGTYLEDCDHAAGEISAAGPAVEYGAPAVSAAAADEAAERGEDVLSEAGAHAAQAEAEAYPAAGESLPAFDVPADVDIVAEENEVADDDDDDAKEGRDFNLDAAEPNAADLPVVAEASPEVPAVDEEVTGETPTAETPVETPSDDVDVAAVLPVSVGPVAKPPVNRYLPAKKKVYVELDQSVEDTGLVAASEEASEDAEEEENVAPVTRRPTRRPVAKKPSKAARPTQREPTPLPAGTFFPVNFGGTSGGAIAIANAFSTGEGGSATSHAIAYGSPDAASLRGCVSCKKH